MDESPSDQSGGFSFSGNIEGGYSVTIKTKTSAHSHNSALPGA